MDKLGRRVGQWLQVIVSASLLLFVHGDVARADTLKGVKDRGMLLCGVSEGLPGFSAPADNKTWRGFDVDFCRAVAAAIFGDGGKVEFVSLDAAQRFEALEGGKIDLLSRNTTWTLGRDVGMGIDYAGISYFDGQGFMVSINKGLSSALQLDGATVCLLKGTTSVDNAKAFFERAKLKVVIKEYDKRAEALAAYEKDECESFSSDRSALAAQRTKLGKPEDHQILPEVISKEPLGPVVRQDDPAWTQLVRWVLFLLIDAEETGWTMEMAKAGKSSGVSIDAKIGAKLGLPAEWAANVIGAVGNYGEIFERNVGKNSPLALERGINDLWTRGGLLYAPPLR